MERTRTLQVMERPEVRKESGARPYTGIEALWDKVDGPTASIIVALAMVAIVFAGAFLIRFIDWIVR